MRLLSAPRWLQVTVVRWLRVCNRCWLLVYIPLDALIASLVSRVGSLSLIRPNERWLPLQALAAGLCKWTLTSVGCDYTLDALAASRVYMFCCSCLIRTGCTSPTGLGCGAFTGVGC
jgi:hypothetical protein